MIKHDIGIKGTHLLQTGYLNTDALEKSYNITLKWHRSRERRSNSYSPFCAYMMNKKWWLEEEFTNHILRFQQVNTLHKKVLFIYFIGFKNNISPPISVSRQLYWSMKDLGK